VQRGHDPFHADLPQHRQRDLVFLTEPSPGFFHILCAFLLISKGTLFLDRNASPGIQWNKSTKNGNNSMRDGRKI
jgi:hypothetical protein